MAASIPPTIALFAKYPTPGAAKTRLIPALGPDGAAQLHRHLVERTIATIRASGLPFTLYYTGAEAEDFAAWLGDDVRLIQQGAGDLGDRLAQVPSPAIVLGADVPRLSAEHLLQAANALKTSDAVIGPAADGGYYLLGYNQPVPFVYTDMAWGTETVFKATENRLTAHNMALAQLDVLDDCDRPEDLAKFADILP